MTTNRPPVKIDPTRRPVASDSGRAGLEESARRFRHAFDDAAVGMAIFRPDGRALEVNSFLESMLGYSQAELLDRDFIEITHPDDRAETRRIDRRLLAGEIPFASLEKRYIHSRGQTVWAVLSSTVVRDQAEQPLYFLCHLQDITERKQAEAELRAKERQLELQAENLAKLNTALNVLLDRREQEKQQLQHDLVTNLDQLVRPYLDRIGREPLTADQQTYLGLALTNLREITAPLARTATDLAARLTPAELEVADLLRHGKTTLEIADLLRVAPSTVSTQRAAIRKKLHLTNTRTNLTAFLRAQALGAGGEKKA